MILHYALILSRPRTAPVSLTDILSIKFIFLSSSFRGRTLHSHTAPLTLNHSQSNTLTQLTSRSLPEQKTAALTLRPTVVYHPVSSRRSIALRSPPVTRLLKRRPSLIRTTTVVHHSCRVTIAFSTRPSKTVRHAVRPCNTSSLPSRRRGRAKQQVFDSNAVQVQQRLSLKFENGTLGSSGSLG
ncbi:hypothetical protein PIB30_027532 [Stylosanthes scabra]|uniref:Uncharacterized protein n=1 Tax=Stylosanthes scabra TaxID=79078 RepID=A0ABU6TBF0_9FABA|nr:hypothetical protein [Stylosanthes scabra]